MLLAAKVPPNEKVPLSNGVLVIPMVSVSANEMTWVSLLAPIWTVPPDATVELDILATTSLLKTFTALVAVTVIGNWSSPVMPLVLKSSDWAIAGRTTEASWLDSARPSAPVVTFEKSIRASVSP